MAFKQTPDGLFENPNEISLELENNNLLKDIEKNTANIQSILDNFSGNAISRMDQFLKTQERSFDELIKNKKQNTPVVNIESPKDTNGQLGKDLIKEISSKDVSTITLDRQVIKENSQQEKPSIPTLSQPKNVINVNSTAEKKSKENTTKKPVTNNPIKQTLVSNTDKKISRIPDDWKQDTSGKWRDSSGRFVTQKELSKRGLNSSDDSKAEIEEESRTNSIVEAVKEVGSVITDMDTENVDPAIDAVNELTGVFKTGGGFVSSIWDGAKKVFGRDKENTSTTRWRDKFFNYFKKSHKEDTEQQKEANETLEDIKNKGDEDSKSPILGFIGRSLGKLLLTVFSPIIMLLKLILGGVKGIAKLPGLIIKGLGSTLKKLAFGGIGLAGKGIKGGANLLSKAAKGSIGFIGKGASTLNKATNGKLGTVASTVGKSARFAGKVGKGIFKRIPLLGGLLSAVDIFDGINDKSKDENGQSNGAKKIGSGVGSIAGMALGSIGGPVGMMVGSVLGDIVGEKIGGWLSTVNWADVSKTIQDAWASTTQFISDGWNSVTENLTSVWTSVKDTFTNIWDSTSNAIKDVWNKATDGISNYLSQKWDKVVGLWDKASNTVSGLWDKAKNKGNDIKDGAINLATKAKDSVVNFSTNIKNGAIELANKSKEKASHFVSNAWDSTKSFFGFGKDENNNVINSGETTTSRVSNSIQDIAYKNSIKTDQITNNTAQTNDEISSLNNETVKTRKTLSELFTNLINTVKDLSLSSSNTNIDYTTYQKEGMGSSSVPYATAGNFTAGAVSGLSQEETDALMGYLSYKESRGNQRAENTFGYIGEYQFGASALAETGLINRDKLEAWEKQYGGIKNGSNSKMHKAFLADPSNWNNGLSKEQFLGNKQLQDYAMKKLMEANAKAFKRLVGRDPQSPEELASFLGAAHLKGAGNAAKYMTKGIDSKDGYGTKTSDYFKQAGDAVRNAKKSGATTTIPMSAQVSEATKLPGVNFTPQPLNNEPMMIPSSTVVSKTVSDNTQSLNQSSNKVIKEAEQKTKIKNSVEQKQQKTEKTQSSSVEINSLLTQDVSNRHIAHIVTGGISGQGMRTM